MGYHATRVNLAEYQPKYMSENDEVCIEFA